MFKNSAPPLSHTDEATVFQVDPLRSVCKVQTKSGQSIDGVVYEIPGGGASRAGWRFTPTYGDRVIIDFSLGYPRISGFLPKLQSATSAFPISIDTGTVLVDTGNYSTTGGAAAADQNKPKDGLVGDQVISSVGGGMLALLRGGSVLLRSSRLCEIFLSKWNDLIRIVSRNFEHYTDASSEKIINAGGTTYGFLGFANNFSTAKSEAYQYKEFYGSVSSAGGGPDTASSTIFREEVGSVMYRQLDLSGTEEVKISGGGQFTRMTSSGTSIKIAWGDQNYVEMDQNQVKVSFNDQQTGTFTSSSIVLSHSAGGQVTIDSSGVKNTFGGHFVNVTSGGVQMG